MIFLKFTKFHKISLNFSKVHWTSPKLKIVHKCSKDKYDKCVKTKPKGKLNEDSMASFKSPLMKKKKENLPYYKTQPLRGWY